MNLTFTRTEASYDPNNQHVWPLKVQAVGVGLPSEVFVYSVGDSGTNGDLFQCVASVPQLNELGTTPAAVTLGENRQTPFYRRSVAEFACRSLEERDYVWTTILEHGQQLLNNLQSMQSLAAKPMSVTLTSSQ